MAKIKTSRIFTLVLVAISIFIIIGYISIQRKEKAIIAEAIDAIPINASFIFEINNIAKFSKKLKSENEIWQQLTEFTQLKEFNKQIRSLDSIFAKSEVFQKFLKNKKILISSHSIGSKETFFLFTTKLSKKRENKILIKEFYKISSSNDTIEKTRTYNNTTLYTLVGNNSNFYFSIIDNILIFSKSEHLVENAIRQKSSNTPISTNLGFKDIVQTLEKNTNHLFVNYSNFGQSYSKFFSNVFSKKFKNLESFANWAAFDITYNENSLFLSGYSFVVSSPNKYLTIFEDTNPQKFDLAYILPAKTAQFTFFSFDNVAKFYANYEKFVNSKNLAGTYNTLINKFNDDYETDIQIDVLQLIDNSITLADVNFNNSIENLAHFTIIKTLNKNNFEVFLNSLTNTYKKKNKIEKDFFIVFNLDNTTKHTIYKLPTNDFVKILFGEISYLSEQAYYFFYDDFVFFANSADDAKKLIIEIYRRNTLEYNDDFKNYMDDIPSKSNILYYTNSNFNSFSQLSCINEKYKDIYKTNLNFFNKIQHFSIQFSFEKKNFFQTHINISYNKNLSTKGLSAWETELSNNISTKPFFFMNHNTYEREIFVQDKDNIVYLINKNGTIIWKVALKEQIVGDVHLVDIYNNSKYQLIFTTSNYIVALDRNGKMIEDYPKKLTKSTKIGLSIADYSGNNDYRLFVPCTNNIVYLFDKKGKEIDGWIKPKTESEIKSKIEYFNSNGKDYIIFSDKTKLYILNRKGETRITANKNFVMADNSSFYFQKAINNQKAKFITTDASGKIIFINLNGNIESKNLITTSKKHTFTATDLNNDGLLDYIITDEKTIFSYNSNGEKLFSYTFKNEIGNKPIILKFSDEDIKIGLVLPAENNVYMLNSDGTITNNFPLKGNSIFSVGILNSDSNFNLIVGNNNFLCNYLVF